MYKFLGGSSKYCVQRLTNSHKSILIELEKLKYKECDINKNYYVTVIP